MPTPGQRRRHVVVTTYANRLQSDPRGFRDRTHRRHSSRDYRNPPPLEEHAELRHDCDRMTLEPTRLRRDLLAMIGQSFRDRLLQQGNRVLAVSVNPTHLHLLCELPDCVSKIKSLIGWCK